MPGMLLFVVIVQILLLISELYSVVKRLWRHGVYMICKNDIDLW